MKSDTKTESELVALAYTIYKQKGNIKESIPDQVTFMQEFPTVISMMQQQVFCKESFKLYLKHRQSHPICNTEELSIQDLCLYPNAVFKKMNPYCSKHQKKTYKEDLYTEMKRQYLDQKKNIKNVIDKVTENQEKQRTTLIQNLIQLASNELGEEIKQN